MQKETLDYLRELQKKGWREYFDSSDLGGLGISRHIARYRMGKLCELGYLRKEYFKSPLSDNPKKRFLSYYPGNLF